MTTFGQKFTKGDRVRVIATTYQDSANREGTVEKVES
jgi:hypothetical protein